MKVNSKEISILTQCPFCGKSHNVEVNLIDLCDWQDGLNIADAFPYLPASEREMLISGICPKCWDKMFGDEDDE